MFRISDALKSALLVSSASFCLGTVAVAQENPEPVEEDRTLQTIVVRGAYIPDEKRETSEISSLVDAADFQVQGDSDAAAALRRVTGLSLSRGKFIFVRGLNERYSSATLNGSPLPSPEPLRRVAPLDLFPTSILESVLVQKTYSPEFSAEFGGGLVEMRTKSVPDQGFLDISGSFSVDSETSLRNGLLYDGGDTDWLGFDDGIRNTPDILGSIFTSARVESLPTDQLTLAGQQMEDAELWVVQEGEIAPNFGLAVSGGQRFDFSRDVSVGLIGSVSYDNSWDTKRGVNRNLQALVRDASGSGAVIGDSGTTVDLEIEDDFERESTENEIRLTGLASIGIDLFEDHEIVFTGLLTRFTTKEARTLIGLSQVDFADGNDVRVDKLEWFERQLASGQVRGEHYLTGLGTIWEDLDDLKIDWRASYSEAFRDAPYERQVVYEDTTGVTGDFDGVFRIDSARRNSTEFSKIEDDAQDIGVDVELPLTLSWIPGEEVELSAGWAYYESNRDTIAKIFRFDGSILPQVADSRVDIIYGDGNVGPGLLQLREVGGSEFPEAFTGHLELDAYYFKADVQLTNFLRLSGGVRYEDSLQTSDTFNLTLPDNGFLEAGISSQYGLPAFTATWNFTDNMQLRGGFSQTITRPQFRELAFVQFVNSETDESFIGNPFLTNSEVKNYDARWEYYFARDEFITIGAFFKEIDKPIEEVSFLFGDANINSFINAPSAELYGAEFEFEKIIPVQEWIDLDWLATKDIVVRANYAYTNSEVSADGEVIRTRSPAGSPVANPTAAQNFIIDGRRLQGQSDHIANLQIGFDDNEVNSQFRILLNYASERIRKAENRTANIPAVMEEIPLTVDLTYSRDFDVYGGLYEFSVKAQNIFAEPYEAYQEGTSQKVLVDAYDQGTTISIGLKRSF